jgi:hypothetical protein
MDTKFNIQSYSRARQTICSLLIHSLRRRIGMRLSTQMRPNDGAIPNYRTEPFRTTVQSHSEPPDRAIPNHRTTYVSYLLTCSTDATQHHCFWVAAAVVGMDFDKDGQTETRCYGACDDRRG